MIQLKKMSNLKKILNIIIWFKKNQRIHFKWKKLYDYLLNFFFANLLLIFQNYSCAKSMFFKFLIRAIF